MDGNCPCSRYSSLTGSNKSSCSDSDSDNDHVCSNKQSSRDAPRAVEAVQSPINAQSCSPVRYLMAESWLVEPPSCFIAGGRSKSVHDSPMENLLIERPTMSVYNLRVRPTSTGSNAGSGRNSPVTTKGAQIKRSPRRARALTTRAGLLPKTELVKSTQQAKLKVSVKSSARNHLKRYNKTYNLRGSSRHQVRVQQPSKHC